MWKIFLGFVAFAGLAIFVLMNGGEIDISGDKHGFLAKPTPTVPFTASQTLNG